MTRSEARVIPAQAGIQERVALLGAPGTGKTRLATELAAHLQSQAIQGIDVVDAPHPQQACTLALLMGLDLPCPPEAASARDAADAQLRAHLQQAGVSFHVVYGTGAQRLQSALHAMQTAGVLPADAVVREERRPRAWTWVCEKCSDPECEHRLFTQLREQRS